MTKFTSLELGSPPDNISLKDFNAVSDGVTDDGPALQAAIDVVRANYGTPLVHGVKVIIPDNTYINTSINVTNRAGIVIEGETTRSRLICGASGKAVFDLLGAQDILFRNLHIMGKQSSPPAVAFFMARTAGGLNSSGIRFDNVNVTGYFTLGAVYGVATAVHNWRGLFIALDGTPTVKFAIELVPTNLEGLISDYQTISGTFPNGDSIHMEYCTLTGPDVNTFTPLIVYEGYTGITLKSSYISGGTSNQAVLIVGGVHSIVIEDNCNFETAGCNYTIYFDSWGSSANGSKSRNIKIEQISVAYKVGVIGGASGTQQEYIHVENIQNSFFAPATRPTISLETVNGGTFKHWNNPHSSGEIIIVTATSCEIWAHDGTAVTITTGYDVTVRNANGYAFFRSLNVFRMPPSAPADSQIGNSEGVMWIDEGNNRIVFRVRYSNGVLNYGFINGLAP